MPNPSVVDTTNLLTILSVLVAVGALITQTDKLRLRFCMAWYDYSLGIAVFLLIHYLVFAPVLDNLGLYYSFGHWKWGLDSSSAVYLILLLFSGYFLYRTKAPKIVRGKIHIFKELVSNFIFTKRFDELVLLVEPQLKKLISISEGESYFDRFYAKHYRHSFDMNAFINGEKQPDLSELDKLVNLLLDKIKVKVERSSVQAREVLFNLVTSPELTENLAVNHPYFGLKLLKSDEALREDFISPYVDALLSDNRGRLYVELKNNQQIRRGGRLWIPENNKLLHSFFSDSEMAAKSGIYKAIGESVCRKLNENQNLVNHLNKPLGSSSDAGRYSCPISSGITLFQIMVNEGIHQGLQDHLWLHYYYYFTKDILNQMVILPESDDEAEFPTRFHYLLYRMINISTEWVEQCYWIDEQEIQEKTRLKDGFDRDYISKEATKVLGNMLESLIESEKLSDQFKAYLLRNIVICYRDISQRDDLEDMSDALIRSLITGDYMPRKHHYLAKLDDIFQQIEDDYLKFEAKSFREFIQAQITPEFDSFDEYC